MTPERRTCEEVIRGRQCGRRAAWLVGLAEDGLYAACDEHARAWAAECRAPLGEAFTPLQRGITSVIGSYRAACAELSAAERDVLRDILCARVARDYLHDLGELATRGETRAA